MANIDRMKFASARGARIQWKHRGPFSEWITAFTPSFLPSVEWRIHPDDVRLQYGPVSTALRDVALFNEDGPVSWEVERFLDLAGNNSWLLGDFEEHTSDKEANFFRLFAAEYLADIGL